MYHIESSIMRAALVAALALGTSPGCERRHRGKSKATDSPGTNSRPQTADRHTESPPRTKPRPGNQPTTSSRPARPATPVARRPAGEARPPRAIRWKGDPRPKGGRGKAYVLRLRLRPNHTYRYRLVKKQAIQQNIAGRQTTMKQETGMGYDMKVIGTAKDGTSKVQVTYTWVRYKQSGPSGEVDYDSARQGPIPPHPMARVYAAMLGASFQMEVTPLGKITKMSGMEALLQRIVRALPDKLRGPASKRLARVFEPEAMRRNMEILFDIYPKGPVRVGGTWTRRMQINLGLPAEALNTYTLVSVKGGRAELRITGKFRTAPDAPAALSGPRANITTRLSGTQTGTMELDLRDGFVRHADITQAVSGTVTVAPAQGNQPGLTWPIEISSSVTLRRK